MVEGEQVHEVSDCRAVFWHIPVIQTVMDRVRQIVPAPIRYFGKIPILFDEFQQRDMVVVGVVDMTLLDEGGNRDEWNAGAIAEEVDGLDVAGIVISSAFVSGDEDRCRLPEVGIVWAQV